MLLLTNNVTRKVHIGPYNDEAKNITFIDFTNHQISFWPAKELITRVEFGPTFRELASLRGKSDKKEMHPFLR